MDYKDTINLPKTNFSMRANLAQREPGFLEYWDEIGLSQAIVANQEGRELYMLHDGPPYANGHIHSGTALNKVLKDVVNKTKYMMGHSIHYIPGWDCHGLPIEWEIEKELRNEGKRKEDISVLEFRKKCRQFARHWITVQKEEFKRLGVLGDWDNPYLTMKLETEAKIFKELSHFLMDGSLYRGARPVMWSVVEKTALAEAEIEYYEHKSPTIYVKFPIQEANDADLVGSNIVIWTTTPWTIPGNRGLAYGKSISYSLYEISSVEEDSMAEVGTKMLLCDDLAEKVASHAKMELKKIKSLSDLEGIKCQHPLHQVGYDFDVPLMDADFVTTDQGTGFVHIAPGHGTDDFVLGQKNGLPIPETVDEEGCYYEHVPVFAGLSVLDQHGKDGGANGAVIKNLIEQTALLAKGTLRHSYPHSWRSKAPLIFRTTHQWFIDVKKNDLMEKAKAAIEEINFYPPQAKSRLSAMIENRPDWCISRQRLWGVPIAIFVHKKTHEPLRDQEVVDRIYSAFLENGSDIWFSQDPKQYLGDKYDADEYDAIFDVLDVWFESATTHAFVLDEQPNLTWPSDLYLEGSDQHRGWFQHSLLHGCGTRGTSPFKNLITHGFVVDKHGKKMSKSLGNVVKPEEIISKQGADILRLWVVASDYTEDLRIGPDIIKHHSDMYRRLRNTLRYLIGNLYQFENSEKLDYNDLPELEKWVLAKLYNLNKEVIEHFNNFEFHLAFSKLHYFCSIDLSSFYFDIRKDCLYCDAEKSTKRRATRTVLDTLFDTITLWLAPILSFTAEETWQERYGKDKGSVHLQSFVDIPEDWKSETLLEKWEKIRKIRQTVTGAIELKREQGDIGSSLQAHPHLYVNQVTADFLKDLDLSEIAITSSFTLSTDPAPKDATVSDEDDSIAVKIEKANGNKCERCWVILPEVGENLDHPCLCNRCSDAVIQYAMDKSA